MFIKFTPEIRGESQDKAHRDEIEVLAWSWGMSQSRYSSSGRRVVSSKVDIKDLSFTKYLDIASTPLMLSCCKGQPYTTAALTVCADGDKQQEYWWITLENVSIASISSGGSWDEDRLTESVTLNFQKVTVKYAELKADGSTGNTNKMGWDIEKNRELQVRKTG
jgi:type VI secretion system secreted protein Hcp